MFFLSLTLRNARKLGKFGKFFLVVRGRFPQNLGWERRRPMHPSPNILHPSPNVTEKKFKGKMTKKVVRNSENVDIFGGPRTETKFVKWSATRKRLRTAVLISILSSPNSKSAFYPRPSRFVKNASSLETFKSQLKTHLFKHLYDCR